MHTPPVILPTISGVALIGVADRGQPNRERIVLRPLEPVSLGEYALLVGLVGTEGTVIPLPDHFFWFGGLHVSPPSWIHVYTGPGTFSDSTLPTTNERVYSYHWGKPVTLFGAAQTVPILIQVSGATFGGFGQTYAPHSTDDLFNELRSFLGMLTQADSSTPSGQDPLPKPALPPRPKPKAT